MAFAGDLDRFALYELCVQDAPRTAALLAAIHGGEPRVLGEDFCGAAALSREWVRHVARGCAIAVDHDSEALARAPRDRAITLVRGDVVDATRPARAHRVDVLHAGNFSIGCWHERNRLLDYLRHARARLNPKGAFVCDLYGGERAFAAGTERVHHALPGGGRVTYTWEQREADPCTGRVVNAIHFEVQERPRGRARLIRDAFVYDWRLWGLAELRDALSDAGFARSDVYAKVPDAVDGEGNVHPRCLCGAQGMDENYDVLVVARQRSSYRA